MTGPTEPEAEARGATAVPASATSAGSMRINSRDLFQKAREVEIDHEGRIYRLRLTQLNKLILTA